MILSDVLKQITPCDRQKPYIFISYSSNDKDLVWRDALEFQKHGYNIWLDEKNLDKTKASWKEDALLAIQDLYCVLMVFYVSKSSLTSESCYNELAKTVDEFTVALHMGPVKFIAIDVDEVGNIVDFSRSLYQEIFSTEGLSKDAKSKMMLTMHKFMKDFFDSNNEKVRIHPKNETNRKMNYYEEILAAFPDEAHSLEPKTDLVKMLQEEAEARSKVESERKAREEAETKNAEERARLEAELREWKEKAEKLQEQQEKSDEIKIQKSEDAEKNGGSLSGKMTSYILEKMGEQVEAESAKSDLIDALKVASDKKTGETGLKKLSRPQVMLAIKHVNESLSGRRYLEPGKVDAVKIGNAIRAYAPGVEKKDVLAIVDTTIFGSAKTGFLVTQDAVYSDLYKHHKIDLTRLESYQIGDEKYHMDFFYEGQDKKETLFVSTPYQPDLMPFLDEILRMRRGQ